MIRKNIFHKIYREMDNSTIIPKFPYMIDIELTNKCNLSCPFCSRQLMKREQGFMSNKTFNRILSEIEDINIPIRFIRWGEPFLHPKIIDYARMLMDRGIPLHITTNGLLLNEKKCKEIIDVEIDSIIFSLQGLTSEAYKIERDSNRYADLVKNVQLLHKFRGNNKNPYITVTTTYESDDAIGHINTYEFSVFWNKYADDVKIGSTIMTRFEDNIIPNDEHQVCREPFKQLSIDWNGDVTACCSDYDNLLKIGNINETSLYDLWNDNPILDGIRKVFDNSYYSHFTLCSKCIRGHKQ